MTDQERREAIVQHAELLNRYWPDTTPAEEYVAGFFDEELSELAETAQRLKAALLSAAK